MQEQHCSRGPYPREPPGAVGADALLQRRLGGHQQGAGGPQRLRPATRRHRDQPVLLQHVRHQEAVQAVRRCVFVTRFFTVSFCICSNVFILAFNSRSSMDTGTL